MTRFNCIEIIVLCVLYLTVTNGFRLLHRFQSSQQISTVTLQARPASNDLSLDINLAATQPDLLISHLRDRKADETLITAVGKLANLRRDVNQYRQEADKARNQRKTLSKDIGMLMKSGKQEEVEKLKLTVEESNRIAAEADLKIAELELEINQIFLLIPNLLEDQVPVGKDDTDNPIISTYLPEARKLGEGYLWHDDLASRLGGYDTDSASKISGARFSVLVGPVARLERAITQYFLDFHTSRGYTEVSVPYIVSRSTLQGTGQLPKFEDDLFKVSHSVSGEDAFLIPTAEVPVANLFRDSILDAASTQPLPIKLVCVTPSFRAEAGSYGKDTRGLLRQHQFHKVELIKICEPQESVKEHEALTQDAEALLKSLKLPFQRVLLCSGDLGFSARLCYDLEVWLPGQQAYREISSCSNCYDFQARRMMLRYKNAEKFKGTAYPHTINGSGVAVGRALIAILENYQLPDGSVEIPEVLQPYMNGLKFIAPMKEKGFMYNRG